MPRFSYVSSFLIQTEYKKIFLLCVMLKRCQTNIYLHKTLLKLLSILISMIGSINTPSLIRKVYNTAARIISPLSLLKYSTVCLVSFFLMRNSPVRSSVVSLLKFLITHNYTHTHTHTPSSSPLKE